jgi:hypothetical protein
MKIILLKKLHNFCTFFMHLRAKCWMDARRMSQEIPPCTGTTSEVSLEPELGMEMLCSKFSLQEPETTSKRDQGRTVHCVEQKEKETVKKTKAKSTVVTKATNRVSEEQAIPRRSKDRN